MKGKFKINKDKIGRLLPEIFESRGYGKEGFNLIKNIGALASSIDLKAFIIGGFVRDVLLYSLLKDKKTFQRYKKAKIFLKNELDLDVIVLGSAHRLTSLLSKDHPGIFKIERIKLHKDFGTSSVVFSVNGKPLKIDFASSRTESYRSHGALPSVNINGSTLSEDVVRRDFTINTIALSLNPEDLFSLKDTAGGISDILDKKISILHDLSFNDDPTRIFRAVRFEQRLGFRISGKTLSVMKEALNGNSMDGVSGKRIVSEFDHFFNENSPWIFFERLKKLGALKSVHQCLSFEGINKEAFKNISMNSIRYSFGKKGSQKLFIIFMAALLCSLPPALFDDVSKRLGLDSRVKGRIYLINREISDLEGLSMNFVKNMKGSEIYKILKKFSDEGLIYYVLREKWDKINKGIYLREGILDYLAKIRFVKPSLTGDDLKKAGITEGKLCGQVLGELKLLKIDGMLRTKTDELSYVLQNYGNKE